MREKVRARDGKADEGEGLGEDLGECNGGYCRVLEGERYANAS